MLGEQKKETLFVPVVASVNLRDLISSGLLQELQRKTDIDIVILSGLPVTAGIKNLCKGLRVTFEPIPYVDFGEEQKFFALKRIRAFVFALSNPDLQTIRVVVGTFKAGTYGEKKSLVYYAFKLMDFFNGKHVAKVYKMLREKLMNLEISLEKKRDSKHQKLFDKYKPIAVLCQAPYARTQQPVQRVAKRCGVPLIGIINSWDNITSSGELSVKMDRLIVWSDFMKWEAIHYLGYKPGEISVTGALQFDHYFKSQLRNKESFCKALGLDPKKKTIAYTLSSELLFPTEYKVVEQLAEIVQSEPALRDHQLLIRIYPTNEKTKPYMQLAKLPRVHVHHPSNVQIKEERYLPNEDFLRTLIETMKYSDVIINYPSTIILDAAIFNKPVINIKYDPDNEPERYKSALRFYEYNHIRYVTDMDATVLVESPEQLRKALIDFAKHPHRKLEKLRAFQKKIAGTVDGKTVDRAARAIIEELERARRKI